MARVQPPTKVGMSFEDYLAFVETTTERHELVDGQLFMMADEKKNHNLIAGAIYDLALGAKSSDCQVYINGVKVRTPSDVGYYPDVFGVCDEDNESEYYTRRPCFIVEVLSKSTEATDRGEKLHNYTQIPGLQTYAIISQNEVKAEVYSRQPDGSWRFEILGVGEVFKLPCVGLEVVLERIYPPTTEGA